VGKSTVFIPVLWPAISERVHFKFAGLGYSKKAAITKCPIVATESLFFVFFLCLCAFVASGRIAAKQLVLFQLPAHGILPAGNVFLLLIINQMAMGYI
jgi:hypothetical protein